MHESFVGPSPLSVRFRRGLAEVATALVVGEGAGHPLPGDLEERVVVERPDAHLAVGGCGGGLCAVGAERHGAHEAEVAPKGELQVTGVRVPDARVPSLPATARRVPSAVNAMWWGRRRDPRGFRSALRSECSRRTSSDPACVIRPDGDDVVDRAHDCVVRVGVEGVEQCLLAPVPHLDPADVGEVEPAGGSIQTTSESPSGLNPATLTTTSPKDSSCCVVPARSTRRTIAPSALRPAIARTSPSGLQSTSVACEPTVRSSTPSPVSASNTRTLPDDPPNDASGTAATRSPSGLGAIRLKSLGPPSGTPEKLGASGGEPPPVPRSPTGSQVPVSHVPSRPWPPVA